MLLWLLRLGGGSKPGSRCCLWARDRGFFGLLGGTSSAASAGREAERKEGPEEGLACVHAHSFPAVFISSTVCSLMFSWSH